MDETKNNNNQPEDAQNPENEPEIFALEKDLSGKWKFSRRGFLASMGAAAAATAFAANASKSAARELKQSGFKAHRNDVIALATTPNATILASISLDETVKLWSMEEPRGLFQSLEGHSAPLTALAIAGDGAVLATGDADGEINLWQLPEGDRLETLDLGSAVNGMAISADGMKLATADESGNVMLWSLPDGEELANLGSHNGPAFEVAFSSDNLILVSTGGGEVKLWSVVDAQEVMSMDGYVSEELWYVNVNNYVNLRSGGGTNFGVVGSVAPGSILRVLGTANDWHEIVHEDGETAFIAAWLTERLPVLANRILISPNNAVMAYAGNGDAVHVYSLIAGEKIATLTGHDQGVSAMAINNEASMLAVANGDGAIKLWSLPDGDLLENLTGHERWVNTLLFTADDDRLISGSNDDTIKIWRTSGGNPVTLTGHTGNVNALELSAEGDLLFSGGADGAIKIWEFPGGDLVMDYIDLAAIPVTVQGMTFEAPAPPTGGSAGSGDSGSGGSGSGSGSGGSSGGVVTYTLPCGSAIPPGATCICNCVGGDLPPPCNCVGYVAPTAVPPTACSCDTVCTCDAVCTCEGVCSCDGHCSCNTQGGHYWYPN